MMNDLQKMGGYASLVQSAAYLIGIGFAFTLLAPMLEADADDYVEFIADNLTVLYIWHFIIYLVAGVAMVPLVLAIHDRFKDDLPALNQITTGFGLIWAGLVIASGMVILNDLGVVAELYEDDPAQAVTVWHAVDSVENGLGGGIELPGGIWALLISIMGLQTSKLPRGLNYLGIVIGIAGILTVIPPLADIGAIFGIGFIVWFAWAGIHMVRDASQ